LVTDGALDAGECPFCGYDGAMVSPANPKRAWLLSTVAVVFGGVALGAYLLFPRSELLRIHDRDFTIQTAPGSNSQPTATGPELAPLPRSIAGPSIARQSPAPPVATPPPKEKPELAPAVLGLVERVDARVVRNRRIDAPEGAVTVSDMNRTVRLTLTGVVRQLRIGTVGGDAVLDASGLAAREIVVTGDLSGRATVRLHAPGGTVSIGGHIEGAARVVVEAPRGEVVLRAGSGRLDEDGELTVTARSVEVKGAMAGNAKLIVTLTGGGTVTLGTMHENASVVYVPPPQP